MIRKLVAATALAASLVMVPGVAHAYNPVPWWRTPAHNTPKPWDGVVYRYIRTNGYGVREICTVYWSGREECRELDNPMYLFYGRVF